MYIRQEKPEDYQEIYELVRKAFETAPVKDGDEQEYVYELRKSAGYIPQLALVAVSGEEDGTAKGEPSRLIGHIMLTETELKTKEGCFRELLLSPLCVALPHRKQGTGGALIRESFRRAEVFGYSAVFLCGDPEYYKRYGFRHAREAGITNLGELDQEYVMVCELYPGALRDKQGTIRIV